MSVIRRDCKASAALYFKIGFREYSSLCLRAQFRRIFRAVLQIVFGAVGKCYKALFRFREINRRSRRIGYACSGKSDFYLFIGININHTVRKSSGYGVITALGYYDRSPVKSGSVRVRGKIIKIYCSRIILPCVVIRPNAR